MMTMSHPVPTFGDSFTITCYTCGMPSSKEWAQKARSRPTSTSMKPYFPFLLQLSPLNGAILREDGSTYLCAFCHASLEAQWNHYENQQVVPPPNRKYSIQKFICAVCGVETYRKRIRALPFQEFPFLEKTRQPGSITLGNNPLAIVCLDCSETLWAQSAEYDRWGLPVHKRHFNWMARPPPPEDSVEATVARLPSGETQLPRCPPIEPSVLPSKNLETATLPKALEVPATKSRSKAKGESPKMEHMNMPSTSAPRKASLTSTTPPTLEMMGGYHGQQAPVPVVTVAPMSSHTTVISLRKDSLALPHGLITSPEAQGSAGLYPQAPVFSPAAAYSPFMWTNAGRDASQRALEPYSYGAPGSESGPAWPWLTPASSDLLRYQTYMSLQSRHAPEPLSNRVSSTTGSPRSSANLYVADSTARYHPTPASSTIVREPREPARIAIEDNLPVSARSSAGSGSSDDQSQTIRPPAKLSPGLTSGKRSPKAHSMRDSEKSSHSSRPYTTHPRKLPRDQKEGVTFPSANSIRILSCESESLSVSALSRASPPQQSTSTAGDEDTQEKIAKRDHHIPKKRNWQVFMKESQSAVPVEDEPKKVQEISHHPKKKKASYSMSESTAEGSKSPPHAKDDSEAQSQSKQGQALEKSRSRPVDSAMDLTIAPVKTNQNQQALKGAGAKFNIEYLCQSEPSREYDDSAARTSVIKCGPKIPLESSASHQMVSETNETDSENAATCAEEKAESKGEKVDTNDDDHDDDVLRARNKNVNDDGHDDDEDKQTPNKEESDDNEGKSERKQQASSTIHDDHDVDERKNEDLPNIEQFIKETITDLVKREQEQAKVKQEVVDKQTQFLQKLGLITPDKKIELEIKSIVSRHERKTLPPLKLRAETKLEKKIDKQLKELLLKIALDDPTLFQEKPETEKCDFMAELGMRTVGKSEKAKREVKWKVILMERIRRELRDAAARGVKHEWEKSEMFKKFANCDLDSFFENLHLSGSESSEENDGENCGNKESDSGKGGSGMCINYPKYIPSYAVAGPSTKNEESGKVDQATSEPVTPLQTTSVESSNGGSTPIEPILKIPVLLSSRRVQGESSSNVTIASDTDESELGPQDDEKTASSPTSSMNPISKEPILGATEAYPIRIDNLIQSSATYWEQVKRNIDDILNELESSPLEEKGSHIDKIRNHLKSQLSDIKGIEKRLRATGKHVLSASKKKNSSRESEKK